MDGHRGGSDEIGVDRPPKERKEINLFTRESSQQAKEEQEIFLVFFLIITTTSKKVN